MTRKYASLLLALALLLLPLCSLAQANSDPGAQNLEALIRLELTFPDEELFALGESIPLNPEDNPLSEFAGLPNWDETSPQYAQYAQAIQERYQPCCVAKVFEEHTSNHYPAFIYQINSSYIERQATLQVDKVEISPQAENPNGYDFTIKLTYSKANEDTNSTLTGQASSDSTGKITDFALDESDAMDLFIGHRDYPFSVLKARSDNIFDYLKASWRAPNVGLVRLFNLIPLTSQDEVVYTHDLDSPEYATYVNALKLYYGHYLTEESEDIWEDILRLNGYHALLAKRGISTSVTTIQIQASDRIDEKFDFTFKLAIVEQGKERTVEVAGEARFDQNDRIKQILLDEIELRTAFALPNAAEETLAPTHSSNE